METKKLEYIDIMRGIAIILVVECHSARLVPAGGRFFSRLSDIGTLGVELFFVASALTLCLSMRSRGTSPREIYAFYLRRFFRIAPLYYLGIALYGALWAFYATTGRPEPYNGNYSAANIFANLFLVHGLYAPANNNVVPGGWSIGCEVLFYVLFPYLFFRIKNLSDCRRFVVFSIVLNLLIQCIFLSALSPPVSIKNYPFLFYFFINQLPVFAIGLLLYFSLQERVLQPRFHLACFGFFFCLGALLFGLETSIPLNYAVIPVLAALSFFHLGLFLAAQNSNFNGLLARLVAEIGRKSYSIYIFHFLFAWDLLGTTSFLLDFPALRMPFVAWSVLVVFNLAASYAVALMSGRFIENLGIDAGRRLIRRLRFS